MSVVREILVGWIGLSGLAWLIVWCFGKIGGRR